MRFLADENLPGLVVAALREHGHDVLWIKESMAGAADLAVLALAQAEERVVVTHDTDFGELAFRFGLPAGCGVVLIRIEWTNPEADNAVIVAALTSRDNWSGIFAVVARSCANSTPAIFRRHTVIKLPLKTSAEFISSSVISSVIATANNESRRQPPRARARIRKRQTAGVVRVIPKTPAFIEDS